MAVISCDLRLVTDKAASVTELLVRAPKVRATGVKTVVTAPDRVPVTNGLASFTALPGPCVVTLVALGTPIATMNLLVPDVASTTLVECLRAAELVDTSTASQLEQLAAEAMRAVEAASAASASATAAQQAETNAKSSASSAAEAASAAANSASSASSSKMDAAQSAADAAASAAALSIYAGTGFPEGKVTAPIGAVYTDSAATAGAIRWIKTSGTGNTGWKVEYGDTGWRAITAWGSDGSLVGALPNGLLAQEGVNGGIYYRRINGTVYLRILAATATAADFSIPVPSGFAPGGSPYPVTALSLASFNSSAYALVGTSYVYATVLGASASNPVNLPASIDSYSSGATWVTDIAWPTTLPGTPA